MSRNVQRDVVEYLERAENEDAKVGLTTLFSGMDENHDGAVSFEEARSALSRSGVVMVVEGRAPPDTLRLLYEMLDSDGNGRLTIEEAAAATAALPSIRYCAACTAFIDPLEDEGFRCRDCYEAPAAGAARRTDLCSRCFHNDRWCERHPQGEVVPGSEVGRPPVFGYQYMVAGEHEMVPCCCCGEAHDIVLSYLSLESRDLHMRPTPDGTAFLCEWCAVRMCSMHKRTFWDLGSPEPGASLKPCSCAAVGPGVRGCGGSGSSFRGWAYVEDAARRSRRATQCRTCRAKLAAEEPLGRPGAVHDELALLQLGSQSAGTAAPLGHGWMHLPEGDGDLAEECACCYKTHVVRRRGSDVQPYLGGQQHMRLVDGNRWLCEMCTTWVCCICSRVHQDFGNPRYSCWSRRNLTCNVCVNQGGLVIRRPNNNVPTIRRVMIANAEDAQRTHCNLCREGILQGATFELHAPGGGVRAAEGPAMWMQAGAGVVAALGTMAQAGAAIAVAVAPLAPAAAACSIM